MTTVMCKACELALDEKPNLEISERLPCPSCGSLERLFRVVSHSAISIEVSVSKDAQSVKAITELLMQTITVVGEKTAEGSLIEAVAVPWFDIIEILKKNPAAAYEIPPDKWEEIIAGGYRKAGFDEVTLTPRSGDYGRDVIAIKKGFGIIRVIDQVKAYKPSHLVTANDVRALWGVMQGDGASKGFVTTTSDFAPLLMEDPFIKPFIPSRLELINGTALIARLEELARKPRN
jgi:restriction system protein